jgi:hypothetical protein
VLGPRFATGALVGCGLAARDVRGDLRIAHAIDGVPPLGEASVGAFTTRAGIHQLLPVALLVLMLALPAHDDLPVDVEGKNQVEL